MNAFALTTFVASALTAAVIGLAGPANADTGHHQWVQDMSSQSNVIVPDVDTAAHR
ncbi:MAG: hypothetical protein M3O32_18130 [Actinomycetota bacterium]|nr:hypothetical protein [Actinomycetota bacterium]